jgi:hypothetical protein
MIENLAAIGHPRYAVILNINEVAAKLRSAGEGEAAAVADQIAQRHITFGDAKADTDARLTGAEQQLSDLAAAIEKHMHLFGVGNPNGDPDDWAEPEDFHVWIGVAEDAMPDDAK